MTVHGWSRNTWSRSPATCRRRPRAPAPRPRYQGRRLSPCKVSWQNESHLRFALKDVLPGQLRFMCESEGLEVRSIRRLRIGALSLARLPLGEWRYLGLHERF